MADILHPEEEETPAASAVTPVDPGEFTTAGGAADGIEAALLMRACEEAGIPAMVLSPRSGPVGPLASPVEGYRIQVPISRLQEARRVLEDLRAALEADPEGAARAAEQEEAEGERAAIPASARSPHP